MIFGLFMVRIPGQATIAKGSQRLAPRDSNKTVSEKSGAVHIAWVRTIDKFNF